MAKTLKYSNVGKKKSTTKVTRPTKRGANRRALKKKKLR